MANEQGVFEREKELCELFQKSEEKKSAYIVWLFGFNLIKKITGTGGLVN